MAGSTWREVVGSVYWREENAREVVLAWRRSGQSRADFCDEHGIAVVRLSRWIARLEPPVAAVGTFHPVRVTGAHRGGADPGELVVELPGSATIRLAPGFAEADLRRILKAFESDAC